MKRSECAQASLAYDSAQGRDMADVAPSNMPTYPFGQYARTSGSDTRPPAAYGAAWRSPWRHATSAASTRPTTPFVSFTAAA